MKKTNLLLGLLVTSSLITCLQQHAAAADEERDDPGWVVANDAIATSPLMTRRPGAAKETPSSTINRNTQERREVNDNVGEHHQNTQEERDNLSQGIKEGPISTGNPPQAVPLREQLQSRIRENIETTATLHVAMDVLQAEQQIKQSLANDYPDVDWNSSSEIDSFISEQLLNKCTRDLALGLAGQQNRLFQGVEVQGLEDDQRIAKEFELAAKKSSINAERINSSDDPDDTLLSSYRTTAAAWSNTSIAYRVLLTKAEALGKIADFNPFRKAQQEAAAQASLWRARQLNTAALQQEEEINNSKGTLTLEDAIALERAWNQTWRALEEALEQQQENAIRKILLQESRAAQEKFLSWSQKREELTPRDQQVSAATPITPQELFQFAKKASERATTAWEKATPLTESNFDFWSEWEKATEAAKEAYHAWKEWLQLPESSTWNASDLEKKQAEQQKNFWLEQLKTAKVEPPLKKEEEKKETQIATGTSSIVQEIPLPAMDEEDEKRLALLKQIGELKSALPSEPSEDSIWLENRLRCSSSLADHFPMEKEINKKIRDLMGEYKILAEEADARRIQKLLSLSEVPEFFPSDNQKALHDAWKKRDHDMLQLQQEAAARAQKEARHHRLVKDWEQNTKRWNILARADELWESLQDWKLYYHRYSKSKKFDDTAWCEKQKSIEDKIEQLKEYHSSAQQEWKQMAMEHHSMHKAREQGNDLTEAEKRLKKSDRVILDLRRDFNDQVYQGIVYLRNRTRAAFPEEIERCKKAIFNWKESFLTELETKNLPLEEYGKEYAAVLHREALKDAKDNIPGDREAYEALAAESAQQAAAFKTRLFSKLADASKVQGVSGAQTRSVQEVLEEASTGATQQFAAAVEFGKKSTTHGESETGHRLDAIAAADQAAYQTWLDERQYLDDIQNKWKDQLKELAERRIAAVEAYFKDDLLPWIMLTPQERFYHNAPIRKDKEAASPRTIQEAIEKLEHAYEEVRRVEASFTSSKAEKARVEQEKEENYQNLKRLLKDQIQKTETSVRDSYQEVERIHDPQIQSLFSGPSAKQKEKAIEEFVQATKSLLELHNQLGKAERKYGYEQMALNPEQQSEREASITRMEEANQEEYLKWAKLTPKEKNDQLKKLEKLKEAARNKEYDYNEKAFFQGDPEKGECYKTAAEAAKEIADRLDSASNALNKALEAEAKGKSEIATILKNSATQHQVAADWYRQSSEAFLQGDPEKGGRYRTAAEAAETSTWNLFRASKALDKSLDAEAQGKSEITTLWKNTATQYQVAADWCRQSAKAVLQGDREKREGYETAPEEARKCANELDSAFDALDEALKAEVQGKSEIATILKKAATQFQIAADWWLQSAEAFLQGDSEKEERYEISARAANSIAWSLKGASHALDKALEAEAQGKSEIATVLKKAATQHQVAADWYRQSAEAFLQGDREKRHYYETSADDAEESAKNLSSASNNLDKALDAEVQEKSEIATILKKAATQYQVAADWYRQSLKAGAPWTVSRYRKAAQVAKKSAECLSSSSLDWWWYDAAYRALDEALKAEAQGKSEIATILKKAATQYQVAADWYHQSAEAFFQSDFQSDREKGERYETAAQAAEQSAKNLYYASDTLDKALKAEAQGKSEIATILKKAATQYQVAADWYRQSSEAFFQSDREKGERYETAAKAAKQEAGRLEKWR